MLWHRQVIQFPQFPPSTQPESLQRSVWISRSKEQEASVSTSQTFQFPVSCSEKAMFMRRIQIVVAVSILAGANSASLLAQTTLGDAPSTPAPIARNEFLRVQYLESAENPVTRASGASDEAWVAGESWDGPTVDATEPRRVALEGSVLPMPHQHQVIQAPRVVHPHGNPSWPQASDRTATANPAHPLPHLIHHHSRHVAPAVIPDGTLREVWKSPFSYGYFGASGSRRWIRHFGYRDRDTEWRLR